MIALLNDGRYGETQILSAAGISELHNSVAEDVQMGMSMGAYGMGWYISQAGDTSMAWHSGSTPDFTTYMALLPEQGKGVVMLSNTGHFMMTPIMGEFGAAVASLLAGQDPAPLRMAGFLPWLMRGLLLIPLLQIAALAGTLVRLRGWRADPERRAKAARRRGWQLLPQLALNLLPLTLLIPLLGPTRGFWLLFMPDYSWLAVISAGFAGLWAIVRTGLVSRALGETG